MRTPHGAPAHQRLDGHELDQDVERGARRVLEGVAHLRHQPTSQQQDPRSVRSWVPCSYIAPPARGCARAPQHPCRPEPLGPRTQSMAAAPAGAWLDRRARRPCEGCCSIVLLLRQRLSPAAALPEPRLADSVGVRPLMPLARAPHGQRRSARRSSGRVQEARPSALHGHWRCASPGPMLTTPPMTAVTSSLPPTSPSLRPPTPTQLPPPSSHRVANDGGLVAVRALAAQLARVLRVARLNVLLGVVPRAARVAHADGQLHAAHQRARQGAGQRLRARVTHNATQPWSEEGSSGRTRAAPISGPSHR